MAGAMISEQPGSMSIEDFLAQEERKELLRFTTAGSVDDGKSTLIGRLLYDSKGVYEDQLAAVKNSSVNRSTGPIDFSLLTDGLRAEREQGITIDVAYRYFATPKRKFIIADTPGHEQYTRNMATGASTAHLAIVLVDARKGILPQSRRHAFIASLLGIPYVVVAVNKMDLIEFDQDKFEQICQDFREFARDLSLRNVIFLPISALDGDNVVTRSPRTPWYQGPSLLEYLETVPVETGMAAQPMRFPVQYVIRPNLDFRGFAGQIASGVVKKGDPVMVLPSGRTSRVKSIVTYDGELEQAAAPKSVTITLENEIDISRGDMLVPPSEMPHASRRFDAHVVWMHPEPMQPGKDYLLKQTTLQTRCQITRLHHRVDVNTLGAKPAGGLELNEIGLVQVEAHRPVFFDSYKRNRATGGFILIDPLINATVAAGMIEERAGEFEKRRSVLEGVQFERTRLTAVERYARFGHRPATVWLTARSDVAFALERELFDRGCNVLLLTDDVESHMLPDVAHVANTAGLIVICNVASTDPQERERAAEVVGEERWLYVDPSSLPQDDIKASDAVAQMLEERGIIRKDDRGLSGDGI
jgi:sulfate adenylyltransferase large subunit